LLARVLRARPTTEFFLREFKILIQPNELQRTPYQ
jgi:hypothetical protein